LLADLDASLLARALAQPQVMDQDGNRYLPVSPLLAEDRFIVKNEIQQTVVRSTPDAAHEPQKVRAAFLDTPDGSRLRSVTVRAFAIPQGAEKGTAPQPVLLIFGGSAKHTDQLLNSLALSLSAAVLVGGVLAAAISRRVARKALRPLLVTADQVAQIDQSSLHRRIDCIGMPEELVAVATKLNEMLGRLDDSQKQRQRFLSDASHELRTPVAALMTAIEVALRRERDVDSYRQTLRTCLIDAKLLQRLVEVLMAQARSVAPRQEHEVEIIDLSTFIDECAHVLAPLAAERRVEIHNDERFGALQIESEPDRLRSILLNLVGNAIEYNREGGEVVLSCATRNGGALISVRDSGVGISDEHLLHLFEPFYRADASRSSGHLGLGLHLVQTHVKALHGKCEVRSKLGQGTTFDVWIPLTHPSPNSTPTPNTEQELEKLAITR
jgi:signal transduction histidine kinase